MDISSLNLVNFDSGVRRCHAATCISLSLMHFVCTFYSLTDDGQNIKCLFYTLKIWQHDQEFQSYNLTVTWLAQKLRSLNKRKIYKAYLSTIFETEYLFNHIISTVNRTQMEKYCTKPLSTEHASYLLIYLIIHLKQRNCQHHGKFFDWK